MTRKKKILITETTLIVLVVILGLLIGFGFHLLALFILANAAAVVIAVPRQEVYLVGRGQVSGPGQRRQQG